MLEKKYALNAKLIISFDAKSTVTWGNIQAQKIKDS